MQDDDTKLVPDDSGIKKNKRFGLIVLFLLGLIVLVGFMVFYYFIRVRIAPSVSLDQLERGGFRFFPLLPIWFAAFIPILVNKDKKGLEMGQDRRRIAILVALITGLIFGLGAYLLIK